MLIGASAVLASCGDGAQPDGSSIGTSADNAGSQLSSQASSAALDNPEDWVAVPGGELYHRSCVHPVPSGARIDPFNGDVYLDGKHAARHARCAYPSRRGQTTALQGAVSQIPADSDIGVPLSSSGVLLSALPASTLGSPWFTALTGRWVVPPVPLHSNPDYNSGVFLWNGLQDQMPDSGGTTVLQPVLEYRKGNATWQAVSWLVVKGYGSYPSAAIPANPGDGVYGATLADTNTCNASGACNWTIYTYVNSAVTTLGLYAAVPMRAVLRGVLETSLNDDTSCDFYPKNPNNTTFSQTNLGVGVPRIWTSIANRYWTNIYRSQRLFCNFAIANVSTHSINFRYNY
jgi:hypothetical protein